MIKKYIPILLLLILTLCGCSDIGETALDRLNRSEVVSPGMIVISEAMTDNTEYIKCSDGKHYDWIELYNTSSSDAILTGCYLTDDENEADKWLIPDLEIKANSYAVIYLSDRGCVDGDELHASFKLSSQGESVFLYSPELALLSTLAIPAGEENLSYGFSEDMSHYGWYSEPTPNAPNSGHFADTVEGLGIGRVDIVISEYMTDNTKIIYDADCDYGDWVELYNPGDEAVSLAGYSLCDSSDLSGKWYFPKDTVISAKSYMLIFCSGKDKLDSMGYLHTSFSLGTLDDAIVLVTPMGYANTTAPIIELNKNVSAVLCDNGEYKRCSLPTPEKENNTSVY